MEDTVVPVVRGRSMLQPGDPLEGPSSSRCCSTLRYMDSTSTSAVLSSMKRRSRASIWDRSPERPSTRKRSGVPRASRVHTATRLPSGETRSTPMRDGSSIWAMRGSGPVSLAGASTTIGRKRARRSTSVVPAPPSTETASRAAPLQRSPRGATGTTPPPPGAPRTPPKRGATRANHADESDDDPGRQQDVDRDDPERQCREAADERRRLGQQHVLRQSGLDGIEPSLQRRHVV